MSSEYKHIDLAYLKKMSQGQTYIEERMLKTFLRSIPKYIDEINLTYQNKSWYLLGNSAFRAKDIMPVIGLKQMALDLHELDMLCRKEEDMEGIKVYVDRFTTTAKEVIVEVEMALAKISE